MTQGMQMRELAAKIPHQMFLIANAACQLRERPLTPRETLIGSSLPAPRIMQKEWIADFLRGQTSWEILQPTTAWHLEEVPKQQLDQLRQEAGEWPAQAEELLPLKDSVWGSRW